MASYTTLDETTHPLYTVGAIDSEYFYVAGGGGAARTGVPNALKVYKLREHKNKFQAADVLTYETGTRAIMNSCKHPAQPVIAVGMDDHCQILELIKRGKGNKKKEVFTAINEQKSVKTVMREEEDYQKVVQFTPDGNLLVTGSSDGYACIIKYPSLELLHTIKCHESDIDDITIHPNGLHFVTAGKDGTFCVWGIRSAEKEFDLSFLGGEEVGFYRARACTFGTSESKEISLYSIHVPAKFTSHEPKASYLVKWDTRKWLPQSHRDAGIDALTQLAISPNGVYLAVGTAEGSISIYISWSLMKLQTVKNVHNIFVTGLAFIPDSEMLTVDLNKELGVLSVSADNTVKVTTLVNRKVFSVWWVVAGFVLIVYLIFLLFSWLEWEV